MNDNKLPRQSRPYFLNYSASRKTPILNAFMFERDLPLGIMPYRRRRANDDFKVSLEPPNSDNEKVVIDLLSDLGGRAHDLEDAMTNFIERAVHYLAHHGELFFELLSDESGVKQLATLPPGRIVHVGRRYIQIIPKVDRNKDDPWAIYIPEKKIWHLTLPSELGSPAMHRKMIDGLNELSEPMPKFALEDTSLGSNSGYDFMNHRANIDMAIEQLTLRWGSIPSFNQIKGTSEYYYIFNRLRFSHAQALIREHIVEEFNRLLKRIGIEDSIKVVGLPLAEDILIAIDDLDAGKIGFDKALKLINLD